MSNQSASCVLRPAPCGLSGAPQLVLASGSPRRKQLLETWNVPFTLVASGVSEEVSTLLTPPEMVKYLAISKAGAVARTLETGMVIGADTIVVLKDRILGKPANAQDAKHALRLLRGKWHQVISGVAVVEAPGQRVEVSAVTTRVHMGDYTDREIDEYVATGEPLDKAGSYAIQGLGEALVKAIEGCYNNVIGFPLCELAVLLHKAGVNLNVQGTLCALPSGVACPRQIPLPASVCLATHCK